AGDPTVPPRRPSPWPQLGAKVIHIAATDRLDHARVVRVRVSGERQEIPHDLRIGLPVEPVGLDGPRRTGFVEECALNGAAAGAVGPQERAIDVEQDELHVANIIDRWLDQRRAPYGRTLTRRPATRTSRSRLAPRVSPHRCSNAPPTRDRAECPIRTT